MSGDLHQYVDKMEEKYYNVSLSAQGMYPQDLDILRINSNNNEKFRSFKSKENIHKKEVGPYRGFGY